MPLFDYTCRPCGHTFEHLARAGGGEPTCPKCNSKDVEKQLSMFKVGAPAPTAAQKERDSWERAGWVPVPGSQKKRR